MAAIIITWSSEGTNNGSATNYRFLENRQLDFKIGHFEAKTGYTYDWDVQSGTTMNGNGGYKLVERVEGGVRYFDILVADPTKIDFETSPNAHSLRVIGRNPAVTELDSGSWTVQMTNVNEAPTGVRVTPTPAGSQPTDTLTIDENNTGQVVLGTLSTIDPDGADNAFGRPSARYEIVQENNPFKDLYQIINVGTSTVPVFRLVTNGTIDYDALPAGQKYHDLKILVRDSRAGAGSLSYEQTIRININNVTGDDPAGNQAPTAPVVQGQVVNLEENAANNVVVATVQSTDDGVGGTILQYSLSNNPGGLFQINQSNGQITFTGGAQNYETNPYLQVENAGTATERKFFNVQVRAIESGTGGLQSEVTTVKVYLNDINEAVSNATYTVNVMNETAAVGNAVSTGVTVEDPDTVAANRNFRYTLVDTNGSPITSPSNFAVNATTGEITVGALGLPNVNTPTDVTVRVRITDNGGNGFSHIENVTVRINPSDVNAPPNAPVIVNNVVVNLEENDTTNVNVATVQSTDDGVGGTTLRYSLTNNPGGLFTINQTSGVITFTGGSRNYEDDANLQVENAGTANERKFFNVQVIATESGTNGQSSESTTVKVYLNDINEAVSDATYAVNAMSENAAFGTQVGTVSTVMDPDTVAANRDFRYTLVDAQGNPITTPSHFAVNATTGEITVGALGLPDVTAATDLQVRVRITDKAGTGFQHIENVTVRVNPVAPVVNKAPDSIGLSSGGSINELAANGTTVATFTASDPDDTSGFVYSLINSDGRFEFVGNQLKVRDGYKLDYEQKASHTITVRVTDKNGTGLSHTQNFTIAVNYVNPEATAGSSDNDIFYGGAAADTLGGGIGNDQIYGGLGKDTLRGDVGDDKLWGGNGNDTLWGGVGKDVFAFNAVLGTSRTDRRVNFDTIKDYSVKDDSIWLKGDLFKSNKALYAKIKKGTELAPKKIESKFFTVGDKAKDRDDYFVYDSKKRVLYYDADGSGSKAAIEMASFTKNNALKNFKFSELFFI